jgi:hypothetical protein
LKADAKRLQNRVNDVTKSRANWCAMTGQCINTRRFRTIKELREETTAWHEQINDRQRGVESEVDLP